MILPGKTKAGSAGTQPSERWRGGRIDALKISARKAEYSLTENAFSPFQAEPTQWAMKLLGGLGVGDREQHEIAALFAGTKCSGMGLGGDSTQQRGFYFIKGD